MKTVFNNSMVAHIWANQSQREARNGDNTFYFTGDTIYSYGSHFPIARHVSRNGRRAILFTTRIYSVSTSRHASYTRRAISQADTVFNVPDPTASNPRDGFNAYRERVEHLKREYGRARGRKPAIFESIERIIDEANSFAEFFGLRSRLKMPENTEAMETECKEIAKREENRRKREEAKQRRIKEQRRLQLAALIEDWKTGALNHLPGGVDDIYLRISSTSGAGPILETSRGATVPLDHAIKALQFIRVAKERGETWTRNGQEIRLGNFHVDRIDADGTVHAGCHTVAYEEIERVAKLAEVPECSEAI